MKTHLNTCSLRFYDIVFVYNVIQTSCFFFLEKVAALCEQSSRRALLAVSVYWNTCSYISSAVLPKQLAMIGKKNLCAYWREMGVKWLSFETIYTLTNSFLSGIPCNSERDWRVHIDVLYLLPRLPCWSIHLTISSYVSLRMSRYWARGKFGEHERGVRVARGAAECNSSLLSALQTSQVLNISTYAQLQHELIVL